MPHLNSNAEELLKETMQVTGLGHWIQEHSTGVIQWSDEIFRIFGYEPLEIIPSTDIVEGMMHPEDRENARDVFHQSIRDNTPYCLKHRIIRKDGSIRYIDARGKHFYSKDGSLVRSLGIIQDITDQVRHEHDLKALSQRLRMATEGAGIGIWDYSAASETMTWEGAMFELYGIDRENFSGSLGQWLSAIDQEDRGRVANLIKQTLSGSTHFETVFRTRCNGQTPKHIRTKAEGFFNGFGELERIIGVDQDITQAMQAEQDLIRLNEKLEKRINERTRDLEKSNKAALSIMQDLHRSRLAAEEAFEKLKESQVAQEKLSRAVEASPVSVIIIDPDGVFEYVNQKFCEITGYSREEIIGKNKKILRSGKHSDSFYKAMWQLLDNGHEWHGVLCSKKKDGTFFWEQSSYSPIFNDKGDIINYVAVKEDITEKREGERQLKEALVRAKEATRAKSEFLANMSHEIRTPMNAIIGLSHIVLQTDLTREQKRHLNLIEISAKDLLAIINDILDLSKIESGKLTLETISFNIYEMLDNVIAAHALKLDEKNIELFVETDPDIPKTLTGDPVRVAQVFNNLLSNSAKFTRQGEVLVSLRITDKDAGTITLECAVADTGIGISPEQAHGLFEKFSQADTSTTRKFGGTGLGLSICRELVEMMDGTISLESELGAGAKFTFTVTLGYETSADDTVETPLVPHWFKNLNVLLIARNDNVRAHVKSLLERFQCPVTKEAADYPSAVKPAGFFHHDVDIIVADFASLAADHAQQLLGARKTKDGRKIPLVMLCTLKSLHECETRALNCGRVGIVKKPVAPSDLYNCILDVFDNRALRIQQRARTDKVSSSDMDAIAGASILLVEDNQINLEVARELLKKTRARVDIALNGREALETIQQKHFDLVLMDIQMPEMDGITAAIRIRQLPGPGKEIPIVAMTAHAMVGDRKKSLNAGMNDHITKPIEPDKLYACLIKWLGHRQGRLPDTMAAEPEPPPTETAAADSREFKIPIQDINVDRGLSHVSGNRQLFLRLVEDFYRRNKGFAAQFEQALAGGETEQARILVHTLKGLAGTLGAQKLQKEAMALEKTVKENDDSYQVHLDAVRQLLHQGVMEMTGAMPDAVPEKPSVKAPPDSAPDPETVLDNLKKLLSLLRKGLFESEDLFLSIAGWLALIYPQKTTCLEQLVTALEFKKAADIVEELVCELENSGETAPTPPDH